jgi:hypothetical protein
MKAIVMKAILLLMGVLGSSSAWAADPRLGDFVRERVVVGDETFQKKTQITEWNEAQGTFTVSTFLVDALGRENFERSEILGKAEVEQKYVRQLKADCSQRKGRVQAVTVPAGTFQSCLLTTLVPGGKQFTWLAEGVPFGVVKLLSQSDGEQNNLHELLEFGNSPPPTSAASARRENQAKVTCQRYDDGGLSCSNGVSCRAYIDGIGCSNGITCKQYIDGLGCSNGVTCRDYIDGYGCSNGVSCKSYINGNFCSGFPY